MSLFGESPPSSPTRADPRSLFQSTFSPSHNKSNNLFNDDDLESSHHASHNSPWDDDHDDHSISHPASPTPPTNSDPVSRRSNHNHFTLSSETARIPNEYDLIIANLPHPRPSPRETAALIFNDADLSPAIRNSLFSGALLQKVSLSDEDIYHLLAICALAQLGEDWHDIEEWKSDLPVPDMKTLLATPPPVPAHQEQQGLRETETPELQGGRGFDGPADVDEESQMGAPSVDMIAPTPIRRQTSGFMNDDDPWSGQQSPRLPDEPDDIHAALAASRAAAGVADPAPWGVENGHEVGRNIDSAFSSPISHRPAAVDRHGSYGGLGGTVGGDEGGSQALVGPAALERIRQHLAGPEETVTVTVLPEKEGMFLFQHRNYTVVSQRRGTRVVRRYSDFVWLLECLHKRYPFRALPMLPPKRIAVNGHHLSADTTFLSRRQRGLTRFTTALVRHPTLSHDQLVTMFLTVPTELSVWRKQATISITDEFHSIPSSLLPPPPPNHSDLFNTVRSGVRRSAEHYTTLVTLFTRLQQRGLGVAADMLRVASTTRSLTDCSLATYAVDTSGVPGMNAGLLAVAMAHEVAAGLMTDEGNAMTSGILEDLKRQRDTLVSMRDLFDRLDRARATSTSTISSLEKKIAAAERKLASQGVREEEVERLRGQVGDWKRGMEEEKRRGDWGVEVVRQEMETLGGAVEWVGRLWGEWSGERVKFCELEGEGWRGLRREVEGVMGGA